MGAALSSFKIVVEVAKLAGTFEVEPVYIRKKEVKDASIDQLY
jgi:hypothetical protein